MPEPSQTHLFELMAQNDAQGRDARVLLLSARTALFCQREWNSEHDIAEFGALAAGLLADVDAQSAIAHARIVLPRSDCPPAIIRALLSRNDGARTVAVELARDTREPDIAIALIAAAADVMARETPKAAVATQDRSGVEDDERSARIVQIKDNATPLAMATLVNLLAQGRRDRATARALLDHRTLGPSERGILFLWATPAERREMVTKIAAYARLDPPLTRASGETGAIAQALEQAAARRDAVIFITTLAEATGADRAVASDIANEPSAEPLAVTLHAIGLDQAEIIRIVALRRGQGHSMALSFDGVLALLRGLEPATSRRLFALFSGAPLAARARLSQQEPVVESNRRPIRSLSERKAGIRSLEQTLIARGRSNEA